MKETIQDEKSVYEIGYLIISSIPEEKIAGEVESIKNIVTKGGASIITEGAPQQQHLAYTISKKTVSGGYDKYDIAYFGWIKFDVEADKIENIKKSIELHPTVLRALLTSTVREDTYLGKSAPAISSVSSDDKVEEEKKDAPVATPDEMDKSIDNMVKEA